ncbi:hypothetical protein HRbin10_02631 [bacterium HR10]|nr:hypothetical protein HRbin10_02631 [bacterium HR10]
MRIVEAMGGARVEFASLFPRAFCRLRTWRRDGMDRERAPHDPAGSPRRPSRWKGILIALLFAGSVGLLLHHAIATRRALTELVPQTALFYLEVSDPERVLTEWRATRAWRDLIGDANEPTVRQVLRTPDLGEWLELFRSPMALVVTGLDWTGDTLRPHLALLWMTEWSDEALGRFAERHVAALAHRAYGAFTVERTTYRGTPIVGYRARASERGLFWSAREHVLILATHVDVIRAIVETADGQRPSLHTHPRMPHLRRAVEQPSSSSWWRRASASPIWGWASGEALALGVRSLPNTTSPLQRDLMRALLEAFSLTVAFALDFEDGEVITRSVLDLDRDLVKRYEPILSASAPLAEEPILRLIPRRVRHFTVYRWTDAARLAEALEQTLRARLPQPLFLVLDGALARMRRALGWDADETIADALGSRLAVVDTGDPTLLLILEVRNAPKIAALIGKHFKHAGARVRERSVRGVRLFSSDAHPERAFAFLDGHLLIGRPAQIERVILAREAGETVGEDGGVRARLARATASGFEITVTLEQEEMARAASRALEWIRRELALPLPASNADAARHLVAQWPPALRVSAFRPEGLWSESRSPLGPLGLALAFTEEDR